jgi:hypothetical protein
MGYPISTEEEWKRVLPPNYDPLTDERLILNFYDGRGYVLEAGDFCKFDGRYVPYLGFVKSVKEIDKTIYSLFRIKNRLYYNKPIENSGTPFIIPKKKKEIDTSDILDTTIKENDNELMVIAKELLKGMTVNSFKSLFTSISDYNNVRREITCSNNGNLTFNRFRFLCDLLGFSYKIEVKKKGSNKDIGPAVSVNSDDSEN